MSAYARNADSAHRHGIALHDTVADADPHGLVLTLMDAVLERMAAARTCIERADTGRTAQLLHSCITLIGELRGSLNMDKGGALARNLSDLYDYMARQLLRANVDSNAEFIREVTSLLTEIRGAWVAIGPEARTAVTPPGRLR